MNIIRLARMFDVALAIIFAAASVYFFLGNQNILAITLLASSAFSALMAWIKPCELALRWFVIGPRR